MFSIVWKFIILYLCESNIEFYMRVKEIPILLLTGYLGSGKTTLVNHILSNKRGIKFAVIVNDIGEVNIDADLIQKGGIVGKKDESLVALQNGCICCTLKMDLVEQIDDIMKLERFDYIVRQVVFVNQLLSHRLFVLFQVWRIRTGDVGWIVL